MSELSPAGPTQDSFERELRLQLADAEAAAARAEAEGEPDLAEAMRAHAEDLRRTALRHAVHPQLVGDVEYADDSVSQLETSA
ncbi:MAG: hypothetical protein QOK42_2366 [Frankiaceae bacterium]|nr:hypothetical protein [Frankiaceae bacterium]